MMLRSPRKCADVGVLIDIKQGQGEFELPDLEQHVGNVKPKPQDLEMRSARLLEGINMRRGRAELPDESHWHRRSFRATWRSLRSLRTEHPLPRAFLQYGLETEMNGRLSLVVGSHGCRTELEEGAAMDVVSGSCNPKLPV